MGQYGPASKAIYGQAQQGQSAVDSALGATLGGQGQSGQDALAASLAKINADPGTAARLEGTAAANTAGAVGAQAGRGSSALSNLISQGASAQDMGAKLPGIAGEFGLQATRTAQNQATTDLANAASTVAAQYPNTVNQIVTTNNQGKQLALENNLKDLQYGLDVKKANTSAAQGNARLTIAEQNAQTSAARARTAAQATADRKAEATAKAAAAVQKAKKGPQLTAAQAQKYKGTALTIASQAKTGVPAVPATGTKAAIPALPAITYKQALVEMEKEGVPPAIAVAAANRVYGKPLTPAEQKKQNAAVAAGVGVPKTAAPFAGLGG
jgi:hypothetical protein